MDLLCPRCGEPWDADMLYDADMSYEEAWRRFRREGCAVFNTRHNDPPDHQAARWARAVLSECVDSDDAASMFDDLAAG